MCLLWTGVFIRVYGDDGEKNFYKFQHFANDVWVSFFWHSSAITMGLLSMGFNSIIAIPQLFIRSLPSFVAKRWLANLYVNQFSSVFSSLGLSSICIAWRNPLFVYNFSIDLLYASVHLIIYYSIILRSSSQSTQVNFQEQSVHSLNLNY